MFPDKHPDAIVDYEFDWSTWLAAGDTISTATVTADAGLTVDSSEISSGSAVVKFWLSGGTAGRFYRLSCRVTTAQSRTDVRTRSIHVSGVTAGA